MQRKDFIVGMGIVIASPLVFAGCFDKWKRIDLLEEDLKKNTGKYARFVDMTDKYELGAEGTLDGKDIYWRTVEPTRKREDKHSMQFNERLSAMMYWDYYLHTHPIGQGQKASDGDIENSKTTPNLIWLVLGKRIWKGEFMASIVNDGNLYFQERMG